MSLVGKVRDFVTGAYLRPEQKLYSIDDFRGALRSGMLVSGPGATELLGSEGCKDANSAVYACLSAICTAFPEAPLRVYRGTDPSDRETLPESPLQKLLDHPNPAMPAPVIWYWVQWAKHVDGNAYLRKLRSGDPLTGNVVELWPISPTRIEPVRLKDRPQDFISYYKYELSPGKFEAIDTSNIVHFKLGLDDANMMKGCSPLKRLVLAISTDDEASKFTDTLLANYAVPGLVVTTPEGSEISFDAAREIQERIASRFSGEGRGKVGILAPGADMKPVGFNPQEMDLKSLHRVPEERIAAVLRVPAIIAGLGAGLDRSTYANFREAREMFTEQTLLPLYGFDEATVNGQLLPDFSSDPEVTTAFDTSDLRALQEDENSKYLRLDNAVKTGWITPDEARSETGFAPLANGLGAVPMPQPQAPPAAVKAFETKTISPADFPDLFRQMVELAEPGFTKELEAYFEGQNRRVKRAILGQ